MKQQLYLLRHANAAPWSLLGNDFSRALSPQGRHHAQIVSNWASETIPPPDTILCSPAKRTRETLAPFLSHWPQLLATTDYVDPMYGATLNMLLLLAEDAFSYSEKLLMVGHNPGVTNMLIHVLMKEQDVSIQNMGTGTLAIIEFSGGFKLDTSDGKLQHLIQRKDL